MNKKLFFVFSAVAFGFAVSYVSSVALADATSTITAAPSTVAPGGDITVTWNLSFDPSASGHDWIVLSPKDDVGTGNSADLVAFNLRNYVYPGLPWFYVTTRSGAKTIKVPPVSATFPLASHPGLTDPLSRAYAMSQNLTYTVVYPENYTLLYLVDNGYVKKAVGDNVFVGQRATMSASPKFVVPGDTVSVTWNLATPPTSSGLDWIALFPNKTTAFIGDGGSPWFYIPSQTGTKSINAPNAIGEYVLLYTVSGGGRLGQAATREDQFVYTLSSRTFNNDLQYGIQNSNEVKNLQVFLASQHLFTISGPNSLTGNYLDITRDAVRQFQTSHNVSSTGSFDSQTRQIANQIIAASSASGGGGGSGGSGGGGSGGSGGGSGGGATATIITLTPSKTISITGETISVSWTNTGTAYNYDWVTIVPRGGQWSSTYPYFYTGGLASGAKNLTMLNTAGDYDLVYYQNNGYTELKRTPITVQIATGGGSGGGGGGGGGGAASSTLTVAPSKTQTTPREIISVSWVDTGTRYTYDWITVVPRGGQWSSAYPYFYTGGIATGTKNLTMPSALGDYDIVYYRNNGYTEIKRTGPITVTVSNNVSPALTIAKNSAVGTQTYASNSQNHKIGSYAFTASSAEGVTISNMTVTTFTTSTSPYPLQNLRVQIGGNQFGSTQASLASATSYSFSSTPFTVPAGQTVIVDVYGDLLSSAAGTLTTATTLAGCSGSGMVSFSAISCTSTAGQNVLIAGTATIEIALDSTSPAAGQVVMGSTGNKLAVFRFTETSNIEPVKITDLNVIDSVVSTSTVAASFGNVCLDGAINNISASTVIGCVGSADPNDVPGNWLYRFHFVNPIIVPQAGSVSLTLKGDVPSFVSSGATDNSAHSFQVDSVSGASTKNTPTNFVIALGATSNSAATVATSTTNAPHGNTIKVLRTKLTVSGAGLGLTSGRARSVVDDLGAVNFAADAAGALRLNSVTITFSGLGANFYAISSASTVCTGPAVCPVALFDPTTNMSYFPVSSVLSTGALGFNLGNYVVSGGTSKSFTLRLNTSQTGVSQAVSASINAVSDVKWTDAAVGGITGLNLPIDAAPFTINSVSYAAGTADTTSPSVPANLRSTGYDAATQKLGIAWDPSTDNVAVTTYKVYMDAALLTSGAGTTAANINAAPGSTHSFTVQACDAANNCSAQSAGFSYTAPNVSILPPSATLAPSKTNVSPGESVSVSWTTAGAAYPYDWITVVPRGGQWTSAYPYFYTGGIATGTKNLTMPSAVGDYDLVYYPNNGFTELKRVGPITVELKTIVITPSKTQTAPGETISVSWSNPNITYANDWIAITPRGGQWSSSAYFYTGGLASSTKNITMPSALGSYDLVYYKNNGYTEVKRMGPVAVVNSLISAGSAAVVITPSKTSAVPGETISVSWSNASTTYPNDWVGVAPTGGQWTSSYSWFYTGGLASGTKNIIMPGDAGSYDVIYYQNNGFTVLKRTGPIMVNAASSALPPIGESVAVALPSPSRDNLASVLNVIQGALENARLQTGNYGSLSSLPALAQKDLFQLLDGIKALLAKIAERF